MIFDKEVIGAITEYPNNVCVIHEKYRVFKYESEVEEL
jgi:hypothetical protein